MHDAQFYHSNPGLDGGCGDPGLTVNSSQPNVYSIANGKVIAIFNLGDNYAIVTKGTDSNFYCYTSLDTVYFSKGDEIKTRDLIGASIFNKEKNLFEIVIMMVNKNANYLDEDKIWQIIKKANSDSSAVVCDATVFN